MAYPNPLCNGLLVSAWSPQNPLQITETLCLAHTTAISFFCLQRQKHLRMCAFNKVKGSRLYLDNRDLQFLQLAVAAASSLDRTVYTCQKVTWLILCRLAVQAAPGHVPCTGRNLPVALPCIEQAAALSSKHCICLEWQQDMSSMSSHQCLINQAGVPENQSSGTCSGANQGITKQ